eukprot:Anaeramoba_flamelloidesc41754_g1_i1.p1 GENE.c41754_g1_i1~~c41754_g1_i1.p1  ORF type:complete len:274 (-),score=65.67 c41754_g1_i1:64-777(-)
MTEKRNQIEEKKQKQADIEIIMENESQEEIPKRDEKEKQFDLIKENLGLNAELTNSFSTSNYEDEETETSSEDMDFDIDDLLIQTNSNKSKNCQKHPRNKLSQWCNTCCEFLCYKCSQKDHFSHETEKVTEELLSRLRESISSFRWTIEKEESDNNKSKKKVEECIKENKKNHGFAHGNLNNQFQQIYMLLEATRKVFYREITKEQKHNKKTLMQQQRGTKKKEKLLNKINYKRAKT